MISRKWTFPTRLLFNVVLFCCFLVSAIAPSAVSAKIVAIHPGESIQQAIDQARAGDILLVSPGIYYETIKLKRGIILRSEGMPKTTIIDGQNSVQPVVSGANESIIEGFTITGKGPKVDEADPGHAVECKDVSFVIKNNIIKNNYGSGIYVAGKNAAPEIFDNKIYSNQGAGIGNEHNSRAKIIGNECYNNTLAGIGVRHQAAPLLDNNSLHHNQMAGIGIQHKNTSPIVKNNHCYLNKLSGIGVEQEASPTLEGNKLYNNGRSGVGIKSGSKVTLIANTIKDNTLSGIAVMKDCEVSVKDNTIAGNIMAGIVVNDGSKAEIEQNTISYNGTQGIVCSYSKVNISKNTINGNSHHGIAIYRKSQAQIAENTINDNGYEDRRGAGIIVVSSDDVQISHNMFDANYGPGVYAHKSSPQIEHNEFINDMVCVKYYASPTVAHNVFYSAKRVKGKKHKSGVDIRENSSPIIKDNRFYGIYGVSIRYECRPLIMNNTFSGQHKGSVKSGRSGIKVDKKSYPIISQNVFYNGNKVMAGGKSVTSNKTILQTNVRLRSMRDGKIPEKFKNIMLVIADNLFLN